MKIIAFAGSNSKNSINKKLVAYTVTLFKNAEVEMLDLKDYELPLFGVDIEAELGTPKQATHFTQKIASADLLVVSLAEHNGNFSVAFKNIFDWATRQEKNVFQDKDMLLMATSPGGRGGKSVLEIAKNSFPRFGANIVATFSLPKFNDNFDVTAGKISSLQYENELKQLVDSI